MRIGPGREPDDLPVPEVGLLSHYVPDLVKLQRDPGLGLVVLFGLSYGPELLALTQPILDELREGQLPQLLLAPLRDQLPEQFRLLPHLRDEDADGRG